MRNTLQEQYNLIKEGKGNKEHFFKSARQVFPDLITPTNSFSDTVKITSLSPKLFLSLMLSISKDLA